MSLGEHLEELRRRLIYALLGLVVGVAIGLAIGRPIIQIMQRPYEAALAKMGMPNEQLSVLAVGAGFDIYMRVALYTGLLIGCPWIIYQVWAFIAAGLRPNERRYVQFSVPFSVALFLAGGVFFVFFVSVPAITFLMEFDRWLGVKPLITLPNQIGFMVDMILAFGVAFQTPVAVLILAKVGLVDMKTLRGYRRHAALAVSIFAAIFAPGDALSMIIMAGAMYLLYELGLVLAHLLIFRHEPAEDDEGAAEGNVNRAADAPADLEE